MIQATTATTRISNFSTAATANFVHARQLVSRELRFVGREARFVVLLESLPELIHGKLDDVTITNKFTSPNFVHVLFWVTGDQFSLEFSASEQDEIRRRYEDSLVETLKLSELRKLRYFIEPDAE